MTASCEVGQALKAARKSVRLSVSGASRVLGVSESTLKRWETGQNLPGRSGLDEILDRYSIDAESPYRSAIVSRAVPTRRSWSIESAEPRPLLRLLRSRRRRNLLSLDDVQVATGYSISSLHRYEIGARVPDEVALRTIGSAVGLHSDEIVLMSCALYEPTPPPPANILDWEGPCPQVQLFWQLDEMSKNGTQQAWPLVYGFLLMADFDSLAENWHLLARRTDQESPVRRRMFSLAKTLVATQCCKDRPETLERYQRHLAWLDRTTNLDVFEEGVSLCRIALLLRDIGGARRCLNAARRSHDRYALPLFSETIEIYDAMIDLNEQKFGRAMRTIAKVGSVATAGVTHYTSKVVQACLFDRMGETGHARKLLDECALLEGELGVGSPSVSRLRLNVSSSCASG